MRKRLLIGALLWAVTALGLWPFPQTDTGELYIVDTLGIEAGQTVRIFAGEIAGEGATLQEALEDLEARAPGQLFLRQTDRLILCDGAETRLDPLALPPELPMGMWIYRFGQPAGRLDPEALRPVLEARERRTDTVTLADWKNCALEGGTVSLQEIQGGKTP